MTRIAAEVEKLWSPYRKIVTDWGLRPEK